MRIMGGHTYFPWSVEGRNWIAVEYGETCVHQGVLSKEPLEVWCCLSAYNF